MEEWKPMLPGGLVVLQTATKGKGLFASGKSLKVGENILTASPIALVVSKDERTQYCHRCLKEKRLVCCIWNLKFICIYFSSCGAGLLRCSQCKYIHYCSRQCQVNYSEIHNMSRL